MILRDDDIFLTESPSDGRELYNFQVFQEVHELLSSNGKMHVLGIISGEIENHPELTTYILGRKREFVFALHGWQHQQYSTWEYPNILKSLERGKNKIIEVFQEVPVYYFAPWNALTEQIHHACADLQMDSQKTWVPILEATELRKDFACFHYWKEEERKKLVECLPLLQ